MVKGRRWVEGEIIEAISLYIRTPFGRIHSKNLEIIQLANELERTPGSVALKMTNIASIDETLDRKGMANASALDRSTWAKYFKKLMENAQELPELNTQPEFNHFSESEQAQLSDDVPIGLNIPRLTSVRQGQNLFREIILASYDEKCAITGISQASLLVAGHIRAWSKDKVNRLNPRNGICLNRLHDAAFEKHLITIEDNGRILYSSRLDRVTKEKLKRMSSTGYFNFPIKFKPDELFLAEHRNQFLE